MPKTVWGVFLSKLGLDSWLARFLLLLAFPLLIYLVYIPNFLFIEHLNITGADEPARNSIEATINSFLNRKLPWPQRNLLLLSKKALTAFLLKNNRQILKVVRVEKKLPNSMTVDIAQRIDQFILQTQDSSYIISNDGLVSGQLIAGASGALPADLLLIKLNQETDLSLGQQPLSLGQIEFINRLQNRLAETAGSRASYYEITDLQAQDLTAHLQNGFKVIFDFASGADEILSQLKLLLSQIPGGDFKRLYYVDMRFEDKGYLCYKRAECVKDVNLANNEATSTVNNLSE